MSDKQTDQAVYAAGQFREWIRGEIEDNPNEFIREYAGLVDDRETLDLLNYYASIYADHDQDFTETRLFDIIATSAATRAADTALKDGEVSQMQGAVGLVNSQGDGQDAVTRMARQLTDEGFIAGVVGPPGAGKTATALDVATVWKALTGGKVVSNITSWERADATVTDSEQLKETMADFDGQVLAVIDEGSQSLTSRGSEQVKTDEFAKDLKYIRKKETGDRFAKKGSAVVIGHTRKDTAKDIRRLYSALWEKPNREYPGTVVLYDSDGGRDTFERAAEYEGITDTAEEYNEHEASHFEVVQGGGDDDGDDGVDVDQIRKDEQRKTAIRRKLAGDTDKEAAGSVDYSRGWVGDVWREWKDGHHRDLVQMPDSFDPLTDKVVRELEEIE